MINILFRNESTVVTDEEAARVVDALQIQVNRDFAPAWGIDAKLTFSGGMPVVPSALWEIVILDNADQAGVLGYHDLTKSGLPLGKVFAKTDLDDGQKWSVTCSHETLEILGDPAINLTVFREEIGQLWAFENCDACEADELGYDINGVTVSDFVFPSWFESFWPSGATQFDFQKKIQEPFELLPGGYISYYDLMARDGWQQRTARGTRDKTLKQAYRRRPPVGSRRERRRIPRVEWLKSEK